MLIKPPHGDTTYRLNTMYEDLCECCARPQLEHKQDMRRAVERDSSRAGQCTMSNKFSALEASCMNHLNTAQVKRGQPQPLPGCQESIFQASPSADSGPSITDDRLVKSLELYEVVQV